MRRLVIILSLFFFVLESSAQSLKVASFELAQNDLTANTNGTMETDQNGDVCALIKIYTTAQGFSFDVGSLGVVKVEQKVGEVWLYVPQHVKRIKMNHQQLGLLEYTFPIAVESARTYDMKLVAGSIRTIVDEDDGKSYLALTVTPANAVVLIDNVLQHVDTDGNLIVRMDRGEHTYSVQAAGYAPENGIITLGTEKLTKQISLQSTMGEITLSCPTNGAQLYVNDVLKGTNKWRGVLQPGSYMLEARKDGYYSQKETITLAEQEKKTINLSELIARVGKLDVSYKPIGAEVWMDGNLLGKSPELFKDILMGRHSLLIKANGYETKNLQVEIAEGQTASVNGSLEKSVSAEPTKSSVYSSANTVSSSAVRNFINRMDKMSFSDAEQAFTYQEESMSDDDKAHCYSKLAELAKNASEEAEKQGIKAQSQHNDMALSVSKKTLGTMSYKVIYYASKAYALNPKAVKISGSLMSLRQNLINAGLDAYNSKDYSSAENFFGTYVDARQNNPLFSGQNFSAEQNYGQVSYYAALAAYFNNDYRNALRYSDIAFTDATLDKDTFGDAVKVKLSSYDALAKNNMLDTAQYINFVKKMYVSYPNNQDIFSKLYSLYDGSGRSEDAKSILNARLNSDPYDVMANAFLGQTAQNNNNYDAAIAAYGRVLFVKPDFIEVKANIAICYLNRAGETREANTDARGILNTLVKPSVLADLKKARSIINEVRTADPDETRVNWNYTVQRIDYAISQLE